MSFLEHKKYCLSGLNEYKISYNDFLVRIIILGHTKIIQERLYLLSADSNFHYVFCLRSKALNTDSYTNTNLILVCISKYFVHIFDFINKGNFVWQIVYFIKR